MRRQDNTEKCLSVPYPNQPLVRGSRKGGVREVRASLQFFSNTWKRKFVEVKYRCRVEELIVFLF